MCISIDVRNRHFLNARSKQDEAGELRACFSGTCPVATVRVCVRVCVVYSSLRPNVQRITTIILHGSHALAKKKKKRRVVTTTTISSTLNRARVLARRVFSDVTGHAIIRHCCWFFSIPHMLTYYDGMRRRGNRKLIGCAAVGHELCIAIASLEHFFSLSLLYRIQWYSVFVLYW